MRSSYKKNSAVLIPVYNEGKVIGDVIRQLSKHFQNIICVDDGSTDNSCNEILNTGAYLVEHPINMGQGAALQTAAEFARDIKGVEYFIHFDADGQHQVEDVLNMLRELDEGDFDIILGSRFLGEAVGITRAKRFVLKFAVKFSNIMSGLNLTDTHNGIRVFNRNVAETMRITMPDMAHASEVLEIIARKKYRYKEVPVTIVYNDYSRSKGQSLVNAVNIAFDSILRKFSS